MDENPQATDPLSDLNFDNWNVVYFDTSNAVDCIEVLNTVESDHEYNTDDSINTLDDNDSNFELYVHEEYAEKSVRARNMTQALIPRIDNNRYSYIDKILTLSQNAFSKNAIIICLLAIIMIMYTNSPTTSANICNYTDEIQNLHNVLKLIQPCISNLSDVPYQMKNGEKQTAHQEFMKQNIVNKSLTFFELLIHPHIQNNCSSENDVKINTDPVWMNVCKYYNIMQKFLEVKEVVNNSKQQFKNHENPIIKKYLNTIDKINNLQESMITYDKMKLKISNKLNNLFDKLSKSILLAEKDQVLNDQFNIKTKKNDVAFEGCNDKNSKHYTTYLLNQTDNSHAKNKLYKNKRHLMNLTNKGNRKMYDVNNPVYDDSNVPSNDLKNNHKKVFYNDNILFTNRDKHSPWVAIKSKFNIGKSKKPHKLTEKQLKKQQSLNNKNKSQSIVEETQNSSKSKEKNNQSNRKKDRKKGSKTADKPLINMKGDWLWDRYESREKYRQFKKDKHNWYFERANSRKNAREDVFEKL